MNTTLKKLTQTAVLTALCTAVTLTVRIPQPFGYTNFGDAVIFFTATYAGIIPALAVGGIGGFFADILSGYAVYALPTLIVKGLEGLLAAAAVSLLSKTKLNVYLCALAGMALGAAFMVCGYALTDFLLYGSGAASVGAVPNALQGGLSIVSAYALAAAFSKLKQAAAIFPDAQILQKRK